MDPITLLIIAGAGLIGHEIGKSSARERIQELQKEILRMQEVNRQREAEIDRLGAYVERIQYEIQVIRAQRGAFSRFARWVAGEHPEILERYRYIQQAETGIAALEQESAAEHQALMQKYEEVKQAYPVEMAKFEANGHAQHQNW